jgi:hypothetical protein
VADIITPNAKLALITPTRNNWSDAANKNFEAIDAIIGTYFIINQLQGPWTNSTVYAVNDTVIDSVTSSVWTALVAHTSAAIPTTFAQDRAANSSYWATYAAPATARGVWTINTQYKLNDFVVSGAQYAICIASHTSGATFAADLALGKWSVLIDLSTVSSTIMPAPSGGDANKFTVINGTGSGYTLVSSSSALSLLGGTSIGIGVLQAASTAAARTAINAQIAGSYQAQSTYLSAIAGLTVTANTFPYFNAGPTASLGTISTYGLSLVDDANAAAARTTLGLGTAAVTDTGTSAGNTVVLNGSAQLPAVDGSLLTGIASAWETGDLSISMRTSKSVGWVLINDGSIGNAASAATMRANADTSALFTLLWTNCSDALCPVSGGRGANAAADFAANKRLTLTPMLGRALINAGAGSGLTTRTLGSAFGAETVSAPVVSHSHTAWNIIATTPNTGYVGAEPSINMLTDASFSNGGVTGTTSSGTNPMSVVQPGAAVNVFIHL